MSIFNRLFHRPEPEFIDVSPEFREANDRMVREQSEENYRHLFEVLLETNFWVATDLADRDDGSEATTVTMYGLPDGKVMLPAYTEAPLLLRMKDGDQDMISVYGAAFFKLAMQTPADIIHINQEGPVGGRVTRYQARCLAEGVIPVEIEVPDVEDVVSMQVGPPTKPLSPEGLKIVLGAASGIASVRTVYHGVLLLNDVTVPTLAVAFAHGSDKEQRKRLSDRFHNEVHTVLPARDLPLSIIPLDEPEVEDNFDASAEPIYRSR